MCGVQCRPTFHETFEKNMQGLTLTCFSTCPWDKWLKIYCCLMQESTLQKKMHYYSHTIITENQTNDATLCLFSLLKALYLTCFLKMSRNVHILCSCRKQSVPYYWLQIIYNWANKSLTSKGHEQNVQTWLQAALALISKQAHLVTTAYAVNTIQFNVNGTDPYMVMVHLHIGLLQLWSYIPHRSV